MNSVKDEIIEDENEEIVKKCALNDVSRLSTIICLIIASSYVLGYFQVTFLLPVSLCCYILWIWKVKLARIFDWFYREHEMREHRKRALEQAETLEWFNYLLNRWWFFSDRTLYQVIKKGIDPVLDSAKPKIIESIEVEDFTLGTRTPFFKYMKVFDMTQDLRKQNATDVTYRNPPRDLPARPKYQVAVDADMALDAPESKFLIRLKINSKIGYTDICVEKFQIRGRLQIVLYFNQNIPFPHLAAFQISFVHPTALSMPLWWGLFHIKYRDDELLPPNLQSVIKETIKMLIRPKVNFDIRMLKKIQLMEFPLIRDWIKQLVDDSLKISLVDPGHLTIPLCNDPEILGRQGGYACGVLTVTVQGGAGGKSFSDERWCSVTLEQQKLRTKEITSDVQWKEQLSFLVQNLQYEKLRVKIKSKRRFGPNNTVVEYILPLIRLDLEQECEQDMQLHNENIENSELNIHLNYSALPVLNVSNEVDQLTFEKNYIERNGEEEPSEVCGVLFVRVHRGVNLIPMDSTGTSDPYVMIFANKDLVQMGHVVDESLNPEWDTMIEFFTHDYTQTTLSFFVYDYDAKVLPTVLLADDNDDFMGSCNMALTKRDWCVFKRELDLLFKFHGDSIKGRQECFKKVGKLVVSVIFRPISSIKTSVRPTPNAGMAEGEPLHQKRAKIDAVTMEAILSSERGSLTVCILRARNLVALDLNGRSDPFVTVCVGESKQEKFKSKIVYRTLNPVWNEQVTFAMPQKHERVTIMVWDKDPFTQEMMGIVRFHYDDLVNLGEGGLNEKHWFTLEKAKSGEIQLAFKVELPHADDEEEDVFATNANGEITESYMYNTDDSDDYLVLDDKPISPLRRAVSMEQVNGHVTPTGNQDMTRSLDLGNGELPVISENSDIVDFTGEPSKYFGIQGKIVEIIGLKLHADIDEIYTKLKLDRHAKFQAPSRKLNILNKHDRLLCRTGYFRVEDRIAIDHYFQMKQDVGVSPCLFLVIEVKSEKKGKDVIDSHSMLLRNFFRGENPATRLIELDNGGRIKLQMEHVVQDQTNNNNLALKRKFSRRMSRI